MARFDTKSTDPGWAATFQIDDCEQLLQPPPAARPPLFIEPAYLDRARPAPKRVTRKLETRSPLDMIYETGHPQT